MQLKARHLISHWKVPAIQVIVVMLAVLGWEFTVDFNVISPLILASPSSTLAAYLALPWPDVIASLRTTLFEILLALILAVSLGVGFGVLVGTRRFLREVIDPYAVLLYSVPKVTLIPLFILWLGLGQNMIIWFAMAHGFFPIFTITMGAMRDVPEVLIKHARSVGASESQIYFNVMLPSVVPALLSGLRLGFLLTVLGVLLGELVASTIGVGLMILITTEELKIPQLYAIILMIAVFTMIVNQLLLTNEKKFYARMQASA